MDRVLVIGAGVSGLACAFDLARAGRDVLALERCDRAGGVIGTVAENGFLFETGPNTIPATAVGFRQLAGDLGIAERMIVSSREAKLRYLLHRGKLRPLPAGPGAFFGTSLLSFSAKLRALGEPLRKHAQVDDEDEEPTFEAFLTRRIGREATRTMAGAFVRGVYAAEIGELGARSAFPRIWRLANEHGGLMRGMLARRRDKQAREPAPPPPGPDTGRMDLLSFARGLGELTDALAAELGSKLRTNAAVEALERDGEHFVVRMQGGERLAAAQVVLAVPARVAHRLLLPLAGESAPVENLATISHAAVTLCHLGFDARPETSLPPGFGFLVPPDETLEGNAVTVLGTLFNSNLFPGRAPSGAAAVTSFYKTQDVADLSESALAARATRDLTVALGWKDDPGILVARTRSWKDVIPRYGVGHSKRMTELERALADSQPGLALCASYTGGVSVEDCITRGRKIAERLLSAPVPGGVG